jgi:pimeloyl-ACP methyl ester carboxylesterase
MEVVSMETVIAMQTVISLDGTPIAYRRSGHGPPLVLVHGTAADHTVWAQVTPLFERHFSVYAMDRRGRGQSGDAPDYAMEREFDDVATVVEAIGKPVHLLGHSYGALCALEAARCLPTLRTLILYEPPLPAIFPEGVIARTQAHVDAGDRAGAVLLFMREVPRLPQDVLAELPSVPEWPALLAAAHTLPREMRSNEPYVFVPRRFRSVQVPSLLLSGSDSPPFLRASVEAAGEALPHSWIVTMLGQQHMAMVTAPHLFARAVLQFLRDIDTGDQRDPGEKQR